MIIIRLNLWEIASERAGSISTINALILLPNTHILPKCTSELRIAGLSVIYCTTLSFLESPQRIVQLLLAHTWTDSYLYLPALLTYLQRRWKSFRSIKLRVNESVHIWTIKYKRLSILLLLLYSHICFLFYSFLLKRISLSLSMVSCTMLYAEKERNTQKPPMLESSSFQPLFITVFICKMLQKKKSLQQRILFIIIIAIPRSPPQNAALSLTRSTSVIL